TKPRRTAPIERAHIDSAGFEFPDQESGDEIPRQAEEHGDTDEAVDERRSGGVLAENEKNCHAAQTIQPRMVTTLRHEPTSASQVPWTMCFPHMCGPTASWSLTASAAWTDH